MRVAPFARLLALASAASAVSAEGINCDGSAECSAHKGAAKVLYDFIRSIDPGRWYDDGEHIACTEDVCAFLQHTGGAPGRNMQGLADYIVQHGCSACGSVPYFYPADNNVADGELTFNYVSDACGNGLC